MALIDRLRLAKDLALQGTAGLDPDANDAKAIEGIVLLDLAFDISARAALDLLVRRPSNDKYPALLAAMPELRDHASAMRSFHDVRNRAQHGGIAPPCSSRLALRRDGLQGLSIAFALAGHDFERFSSVSQIHSDYLRAPLEHALAKVGDASADAMALVMLAFSRSRGWAEHVIGDTLIPNEMWVHASPRWSDVRAMAVCADNRQEYVDAMLRIAGSQVLRLSIPAWLRLQWLGNGHIARLSRESGWSFMHKPDAQEVTVEEVNWAIETVARAILSLEQEWPDLTLVTQREDTPSE